MNFNFNTWIRQPTTIHGLAVMAGGFAGLASHVATGNQMIDGCLSILAYFLTHVAVDDNSVSPAQGHPGG
jgi:hypothetical protein